MTTPRLWNVRPNRALRRLSGQRLRLLNEAEAYRLRLLSEAIMREIVVPMRDAGLDFAALVQRDIEAERAHGGRSAPEET